MNKQQKQLLVTKYGAPSQIANMPTHPLPWGIADMGFWDALAKTEEECFEVLWKKHMDDVIEQSNREAELKEWIESQYEDIDRLRFLLREIFKHEPSIETWAGIKHPEEMSEVSYKYKEENK